MACGCPFLPHFCGRLPSFIALSVKFRTLSHFPLRAYIYARLSLCFIILFTSLCYIILFPSLCLLRLHMMQASALPSLPAFITFGYYPNNDSIRAADNSVYAWHSYMPSPCFPLKFVLSCIYFVLFLVFICKSQNIFVSLQPYSPTPMGTPT